MAQEYSFLDESGLGRVVNYVKAKFATLSHSHKLSEITDYTVDSSLSSTSTNPVQNKAVNSALSGKVPTSRKINGKSLTGDVTLSASDVGASASNHDHDSDYDAKGSAGTVQSNLESHTENGDIHFSATERSKLSGIASGAEVNVQSDWNETNTGSDAFIKNKPTSMPASDVSAWAKASSKPSYTYSEVGADKAGTASSTVSSHNTNTEAHNDIRTLISNLTTRLNTLANSTDTELDQMAELVEYIKDNRELIEGVTTNKVNVSDIVNNLTTNVTNKPLSAAQGVAIKALIDALQTAVNGKSNSGHTHDDRYYTESEVDTKLSGKANSSHGNHVPTTETANNAKFLRNDNTWQTVTPDNIGAAKASHGTHVSYSTTAPVMDGTASVGTAGTVARSDHKHPTDTSRASATDLSSHTGDTTKHITSDERTGWNSAKTHASSTHARTDATKVEASTTNGNVKINGTETKVYTHPSGTNPHGTTKSDVGLGNVPNVATNDQTPTFTQASSRANIASGEKLSIILGKIMKYFADLKTVAFTGSYNDLSNKPTIPSAYTHPTTAGNKHIPSGGSSGQILRWSSNGTAVWGNESGGEDEIVEITQEDYIALGDAVKTNGITYFIKDAKSYVTSLGIAIQAVKALPSDAASKTNTLYLIAGDAIEVEGEVSSVEKVLGLPSDASNNPDVMYVVL